MSFSSSLMTSMGISLGGLELATDYLFANSELYEPELTEVKTTISKKPQNLIVKKAKPVKPKVTREVIINKFNIVQERPSIIIDTVIDNINTVNNEDDFDFSFDSTPKEDVIQFVEEESTELLEANLLMQKINTFNNNESSVEEDEESFELDEDIDIEDEDNIDIDDEDIEIEEDDFDIDDEDFDIDDEDFDIDDEDDEEIEIKPQQQVNSNQKVEQEFSLDELDIEDDIDIEENNNYEDTDSMIDELEDDESNIDDIDIDEDELDIEEDELDIDDEDFDIDDDELDIEEDELDIEEDTPLNKHVSTENKNLQSVDTKSKPSELESNKELEQLRNEIASLNREIQKITATGTSKETSMLNEGVIKKNNVDSLDTLLSNSKPSSVSNTVSKHARYSEMNSDQLYKYVRNFMIKLGVDKRPVDMSALTSEFGERNIKTLIQKSYLIKIGKGVTTGR